MSPQECCFAVNNDEYEFIPLVRRKEYIDDCINLLNQEWPRSYASRENSLKRALNEKPDLSLILISKNEQKLIGHARICILPMNSKGCWLESVIVHDSMRGKGIGKVLMNFIELKAQELGYSEIYLSTEDKEIFYRKCGYNECQPLLNMGAASKLINQCGIAKFLKPTTNHDKKEKESTTTQTLPISTPMISSNGIPPLAPSSMSMLPPPPPPPLPIQICKPQSKMKTYFMKKM